MMRPETHHRLGYPYFSGTFCIHALAFCLRQSHIFWNLGGTFDWGFVMPKHIQPLTAKRLDAVHPRDGDIIELGDGLLPGLRVRISRGGRFWSLNIRNAKGERRRFDVGANLS